MSAKSPTRRSHRKKPEVVDIERPDGELLLRDAAGKPDGLTDVALLFVEALAYQCPIQNVIASRLGLSHKQFKSMLGKADDANPVRLAWERGFAKAERDMFLALKKHGKQWAPALMHLTKSKFGWREADKVEPLVENKIQLVLAEPTSKEEMFKRLGITGPLDFRKDKSQPLPDGLLLDGMPPPMKLISPPPPEAAPVPVDRGVPPGPVTRTVAGFLKSSGKWDPNRYSIIEDNN